MQLLKQATAWSQAAFGAFLLLAALLPLLFLCGFVNASPFAIGCASLVLCGLGLCCLLKNKQSDIQLQAWKNVRPYLVAASIPLGFYLMERPYSESFPFLDPLGTLCSLFVLAMVFSILFFTLQRSRAGIVLFLILCLVAGIANHFLIEFKGQPVLPSDALAFKTALEVSGGYTYNIDSRLLETLCVFACALVAISYIPKSRTSLDNALRDLTIAAIVGTAALMGFKYVDFEHHLHIQVDPWSAKEAYSSQGSAACFVKRMQDLTPNTPIDYSAEAADALLRNGLGIFPLGGGAYTQSSQEELPTVIAIMNESFSDLSAFPGMEDSEARPNLYYQLCNNAIESGTVYVSAKGGGTCNSEFEFLSGSSSGFLGGGVYPYMQYNLEGTETLATYFKSFGYTTCAIHPNEAENWRRDRVYPQMGFDKFLAIDSFKNPETLRDMVTDEETYNAILNELSEENGPQFIFDVTMQNHGGYDKGLPDDVFIEVDTPDSKNSAELSEYTSVIKQSELDLVAFLDALNALDRPVVLCFFGDHQPGFNESLWEETNGRPIQDASLDEIQECWNTPYMIWANDTAKRTLGVTPHPDSHHVVTSLNYLGTRLVEKTGLPLTPYQQTLLEASATVPALNLNGYLTLDGSWNHYDVDEAMCASTQQQAQKTLHDLRILQFDNLFNTSTAKSDLWNTASAKPQENERP